MAQKFAPPKKNSRDISPVSPTFSISGLLVTPLQNRHGFTLYIRGPSFGDFLFICSLSCIDNVVAISGGSSALGQILLAW